MSNWWRRLSARSNRWRRGREPAVSREEQLPQFTARDADVKDDRRRAVQRYKSVVGDLTAMLYREDPIGIASGPDDEYEPEAATIAVWLMRAKHLDLEDVRRQVHEGFVGWFGADIAGEPARYDSIAQAVLAVWHRHHPPESGHA
jgi:hypothetical protein